MPGSDSNAGIRRRNHGRGHSYYIDGAKADGVTTLIGSGIPKPNLLTWAGDVTAEYAVDRWEDLSALPPSKRLKEIKGARYADRDAAAGRGNKVHSISELLVTGTEVEVPEGLEGHVESCVRFLNEWQIRPILVEATVAHRRWRYAGTLDLVAGNVSGEIALYDYKTSRSGIFGETGLQLAAYRHAEVYIDPVTGEEKPVADLGITATYGVWIRADGYDVLPVDSSPGVFKHFTHALWIARHMDDLAEYVGAPLDTPTEGTAA